MPNGDDHDLLIRIDAKMDTVQDVVNAIKADLHETKKNLYGKIETHSRQIAFWRGALGVLGILWGVVLAVFGRKGG